MEPDNTTNEEMEFELEVFDTEITQSLFSSSGINLVTSTSLGTFPFSGADMPKLAKMILSPLLKFSMVAWVQIQSTFHNCPKTVM